MSVGHTRSKERHSGGYWAWLGLVLLALAAAERALCAEPSVPATEVRAGAKAQPGPAPLYALVLPLDAGDFRAPAEALRAGFLAAAQVGGEAATVQVVAHGESGAPLAFAQAEKSGAAVIVGPLTRGDVGAVLAQRPQFPPTLLLNTPEQRASLPQNVAAIALSVEADARQLARLAWKEGRERVAVIAGGTPLNKRFLAAFVQEAESLGISVVHRGNFGGDTAMLPMLRQGIEAANADALVLALDAGEARVARGYLSALPAYASGQVFDDRAATELVELANVRFVEMPWLAQPDHPAVMAYPRPDLADATLQRLYALGIDAYRVARLMARGISIDKLDLDGVTGQLSGRQGAILVREAMALVVKQGEAVPLDAGR